MGCGAGKTTKESVLDVHAPADKPKVKSPPAEKPKLKPKLKPKAGLVAEPSTKLDPEVLEGLAKLLRRFSTIEVGKPRAKSLRPHDLRAITALGQDNASKPVPNGTKALPQGTDVKPLSKPTDEETKSTDPKPTLVQEEASQAPADPEPIQAFNQPVESSMEQRYSPEPPRPEEPSDDEELHTEDADLKRQRLEREQQAREEAERRAAEQRSEQERQAALHKGQMTSMESQAQDILSKYQ